MGISALMSYRGACIFEAVGLKSDFVDRYFHGTASRVEGIGLFEVMQEAVSKHQAAYGINPQVCRELSVGGQYAWRPEGEEHMWTPEAVVKLQQATREKNYRTYREYADIINDQSRRQMTLRGLLDFRRDGVRPIPLDAVEPAKEIVKRFATGRNEHGLHFRRGACHAGGGDEPHRRDVQYRRGRRGSETLSGGIKGRTIAGEGGDDVGGRVGRRSYCGGRAA